MHTNYVFLILKQSLSAIGENVPDTNGVKTLDKDVYVVDNVEDPDVKFMEIHNFPASNRLKKLR